MLENHDHPHVTSVQFQNKVKHTFSMFGKEKLRSRYGKLMAKCGPNVRNVLNLGKWVQLYPKSHDISFLSRCLWIVHGFVTPIAKKKNVLRSSENHQRVSNCKQNFHWCPCFCHMKKKLGTQGFWLTFFHLLGYLPFTCDFW